MESSFSESYKAAGVDITAGYKSVELMKQHIKRTLTPGAGRRRYQTQNCDAFRQARHHRH